MGRNKNRNTRKNQNKEWMDERSPDLTSGSKLNSMSSNNEKYVIDHAEGSFVDMDGPSKYQEYENFAASKTGAKPKLSFQYLDKNTSGSNISSKYEKHIGSSIKTYEEKWDNFYKKYLVWKNERLNTISKLKDLAKKVHDEELNYNKTNIVFKELNVNSRELKESNNSTIDFFASLGTFLTDAACGITSLAQAFNVDACNMEFKKIMEEDAGISKSLYIIRSQCIEQYRDVEEVVRQFHSETFENSWQNVSKTLSLDNLWHELKYAHEENLVSATVNCLDRFIAKNANIATFNKIYDSFGGYIDNNPAVLDACKSAGKLMYGIYDTWGRDQEQRNGIAANVSHIANRMILSEEKNELCELRSRVYNSEMTQTKLESKIESAIDSLKAELNEMSLLFNMSLSDI